MKLVRVEIENFRRLGRVGKPFVLAFTDALGRLRDFTLLVGPNTVGKTTVLDAIAGALERAVDMPITRRGFALSPAYVVRRGEATARVVCHMRFDATEVEATRQLLRQPDIGSLFPVNDPDTIPAGPHDVKVVWTYPSPKSVRLGATSVEPSYGRVLLRSRSNAARVLATGRQGQLAYRQSGSVFTFDQERTGFGRTVSRFFWNVAHGRDSIRDRTQLARDPRAALIDMALRSRLTAIGHPTNEPREFDRLASEYARVCAPHRIVGPVEDERGDPDIVFSDGSHEYRYDGLSSGERMALLLLIRFVAEHIHRSVVLIDELELNQHPLWQRTLLHQLPLMGEDNQIIATTHSPYLRDAVRPDAVIDLGDLGDRGAG